MNINTDRAATRRTRRDRARRVATLSVAGVLAGLALAPTAALAQRPDSGSDGAARQTGDKWSYMYDAALRKEAMARVQEANEAPSDASTTASGYVNAWSYMYDTDQGSERVVTHRIPPSKARHDSIVQRKAHPALARIMVSVTRNDPATCYLPDSLDPGTRRLIAVQLCSKAHIVPAVVVARAAAYEQAYSLGHL